MGRIPTSVSVAQLIELYRVSSLSDGGNPYFLRQAMIAALETIGQSAMVPLEKALNSKEINQEVKRVQELTRVLAAIRKK